MRSLEGSRGAGAPLGEEGVASLIRSTVSQFFGGKVPMHQLDAAERDGEAQTVHGRGPQEVPVVQLLREVRV